MVGMHYEEIKLRQQEIEVKALIALSQQDVIVHAKMEAVHKLLEIAYPDKVADKINQETLKDNYKQRSKRNYWGEIE